MKKMKREVSIRKLSAEERASALDLAWRPTRNCTILIMTRVCESFSVNKIS